MTSQNTTDVQHSFDNTCFIAGSAGLFGAMYPVWTDNTALLSVTPDGVVTVIMYAVIGTVASYFSRSVIDFYKRKRR